MQITLRRLGDITRQTEAVVRADIASRATVIKRKTTIAKNALRRKITGAKLGQRLANTIQDEVFPPSGRAHNPKGRVFSKAIYKRAGGLADLITVFRFGAVIHPVRGLFLFIGRRLAKAAKLGDHRIAKSRSVTILPRIGDLDAEFARVTASLDTDIAAERDRRLARIT